MRLPRGLGRGSPTLMSYRAAINSEQRRQFVLRHRTAIFGYNRAEHGPAMSVVYYSATPDEIVVSTMAE